MQNREVVITISRTKRKSGESETEMLKIALKPERAEKPQRAKTAKNAGEMANIKTSTTMPSKTIVVLTAEADS